jgi:hypothetical protein
MPETAAPAAPDRTDAAFALLAGGVPLSLLLDLAGAVHSGELYREETGDTRWVPTAVA